MTRDCRSPFSLRCLLRRRLSVGLFFQRFVELERVVRNSDGFACVIEQIPRLTKHARLKVKRRLLDGSLSARVTYGFDMGPRDSESLETSRDLWSAVIRQWCQCLDLIKRDWCNAMERFTIGLERCPFCRCTFFFDKSEGDIRPSPNDFESLRHPGCDEFCSFHVVSNFLLILSYRKRECDNNSCTCAKCNYTIHDDAGGIYVHPFRRMRPFEQALYETRREATDSKRQQSRSTVFNRVAQGIPVLHFSPVLNFRAIVARPTEGS